MSKRIISSTISVALLAGIGVALWQRDALFDMWRLRNYTAPAQIVKLADATTMNPSTRRLFYVYRPSLEDKRAFNSHCSKAEQTIVLGCYIEHDGIYLYNVPDKRLSGVVEVTAAHELLHAGYDRLSSSERKRIDKLTADFAATITDERIKETIENYRKKDPSIVPNELHSILGTEVRNLTPELEGYYSRYFSNRAAIVDFADAYRQEFTRREQEVADIDKRLASLKQQIDSLNSSLETQQANLKSQFDAMQADKRNRNIEAYNQAVPIYNQAVGAFNMAVNRQKQLVGEYNSLVEQRNNLAIEENELIKALDSRSTIEAQ